VSIIPIPVKRKRRRMERGFLNVTESAALHGKRTVSALAKEIKGYSTAQNF
jgi:hypothetical protein